MLGRSPSPKRFLQFVRHVGADENTFSICHKFMSISRGKSRERRQQSEVLVSRILSPPLGEWRSFIWAVRYRTAQAAYPKTPSVRTEHGTGPVPFVFLFGLAPRGVYLAGCVTTPAGELLPHRFTHYLSKEAGLFSVALVVTRYLRAPGCYPARCPLVFGLSSPLSRSDRPHFQLLGLTIIAKKC